MDTLKIILSGSNGAVGRAVSNLAAQKGIAITAGFDKTGEKLFDYPVYASLDDIAHDADVLIDFSHYSVQRELAEYCLKKKTAIVSATTGLREEDEEFLVQCSQQIPVFRSKNFSFGISVLKKLAEDAARMLSSDFDIELVELHHNKKIDSPSGTAQLLAESVIKGAGKEYSVLYGRHGNETRRSPDEITVHSVRGGSIVGIHELIFAGEGEVIKISHDALSKDVFASGAIKAAQFISTKKSGYYTMDDIVSEEKI